MGHKGGFDLGKAPIVPLFGDKINDFKEVGAEQCGDADLRGLIKGDPFKEFLYSSNLVLNKTQGICYPCPENVIKFPVYKCYGKTGSAVVDFEYG
jgi:hypothetical protein